MTGRALPRIAIVGGGFSGAAVATHVARRAAMPLAVDVIEPRAALGGGVAYSALDPSHRTNVAATRMSLFTDEPGHFERWLDSTGALADDPDARLPDGRAYPRRRVFGEYVAAQLATAASHGRAVVRHLRDRAVGIQPQRGGWLIELGSGGTVMADLVVLAVSHPPPEPPRHLVEAFATQPGFVADPWAADAFDTIKAIDTVVIMGAALSMADAVASLERRGHRGRIIAFSRRGLVSRAHAASAHDAFGDFATNCPATAVEMLRRVRHTIREAAAAGHPWQAVIDAVRRDGQAVWHALAPGQRRALLRHLRPYWEVHRYRIAPQVGAIIERRRAAGTLEMVAAGLGGVEVVDGKIRTELLLRGRHAQGRRREVESDAFVLTTGPAHASALQTNPALRSLAEQGCVQADPLELGLLVDRQHRAVPATGPLDGTLLVAGPLARGTFGELMGLPQVAEHAEQVADAILQRVERGDARETHRGTTIHNRLDYIDKGNRQRRQPS